MYIYLLTYLCKGSGFNRRGSNVYSSLHEFTNSAILREVLTPHPLQIPLLITRTASVTSTPVLSASRMIIQISNVVQILKLQSKSNLIAASVPLNKDIDRYTTRRIWNHQKHENSLTFDFFNTTRINTQIKYLVFLFRISKYILNAFWSRSSKRKMPPYLWNSRYKFL